MQGRPRQAAHDSALVVAVFLHAREVVVQGLVLGLVHVSGFLVIPRRFSHVPGNDDLLALLRELLVGGELIDELALGVEGLDEIFFFGVWTRTPLERPA